MDVPESLVEACFNITGSPEPSRTISKGDGADVSIPSTQKNSVRFGPLKITDTGNITVKVKSCYGNSNVTIIFTFLNVS